MSAAAATILIVDDEVQNRKLLETLLQPEGYQTLSAANGEEALAAIEKNVPDLILLDIMMPGIDGYQMASILKANPSTANIPIIMVTSHSDRSARLNGLSAGAEEFLTKPVDRAELWLRVRNLLRLKAVGELLRHVAEQQIKAADKQSAILDSLPAHIALLDSAGVIVSVNQAWRSFAGENALRGSRVGVGVNYLQICDEAQGEGANEAQQVARGIRAVLDGQEKRFSIEYPCHSPTEKHWFMLSVTPLTDDRPDGAVVMHTNITVEKLIEESLRASEFRFRQMADNIQDIFFLVDAENNKTLYISPAYEIIFGKSCETILGKPWMDAVHPDDRAGSYENSKIGLAAGKIEIEYRILRPDGAIRWIESRGFPVYDDNGKIVRIAGVAKDITEKKLFLETLSQNEQRTRAIVESALDAVVVMDADGSITDWNMQAEITFGWPREEVLGLPLGETIVPHALREAYRDGLQEFLETGFSTVINKRIEALAQHRDGHEFSVELAIAPTFLAGQWIFSAFVRDLTERKRAEAELRRFAAAMDTTPDAIYLIDRASMRFIHVNDSACRMQQRTREELLETDPMSLLSIPRSELEKIYDAVIAANTASAPVEMPVRRKDGSELWVELRRHAQRSGEGWTIVSLARDITERREADSKIRRLNRVYAVLSGINTLIVRVRDRDELFREACRIAVEAGAFKMAWIGLIDPLTQDGRVVAWHGDEEGRIDRVRLTARDGTIFSEQPACSALRLSQLVVCNDIATDAALAPVRNELLAKGLKSAGYFPITVAGQPEAVFALFAGEPGFFDEEETSLLLELANDISFALDHIGKEEKLSYLAYYDALTGLANRSLFFERVGQHIRSAVVDGKKLAIGLIDLDRFKNINDSLGQAAGDLLLKQVADWLTLYLGDPSLLARLGADHFAVVLPEAKQDGDITRSIENLMAAFIVHPFRLNDGVFRVSVKLGIAQFPEDGASADALFKNAEAALKHAKSSGDRYLRYAQNMNEKVAGKVTMENQLRHALENEEFVLHYQPKVNLASGKVTSAEALIRWNDPRTGLVPPGRFISVLEETGLIHEVGRWALRQAITDYVRWRHEGLPAVRIAVNVSPLQLRHRGFLADIKQAIGSNEHAAAGLELELTESVIMEDVKHSIATLQAIRAMGLTIAIDDFGTGFSSLSYLSKLPVDTLKIDRSFVTDMTLGPDGLALVSTIIHLAQSLKLKVVAEGVETEEEARILRLMNCDEMQGFLFSKALPGDIFEARYLTGSPL